MFYVSEEKKKLFFMETKKRGHTDSRHSTTVSYNSSLLATQHTFHANPVNRMFSENMSNPCTQFKQKITSKVRCRNIAMNKTKSNQCRLIELAQQMFIHLICSVLFFIVILSFMFGMFTKQCHLPISKATFHFFVIISFVSVGCSGI